MDDKIIKVYCLIIGSHSVGKTTLINKLNQSLAVNNYEEEYRLTTRINIIRKSYGLRTNEANNNSKNKRIEIIYIEFPGKQIYQNFLAEFYRKSETTSVNDRIIIIVIGLFDVSNRSSLTILEQLFNSVSNKNNNNHNNKQLGVHRIMVANKIDLIDKRIISNNEGQSKCKMLKCRYIECTIRNDTTMQELEQIIIDIVKNA
ncbi:hypothetical protein HUG17_1880 [Dermatophagoides farinae]|uniref:Uncharacterized protein n=1 Tax=Dermatophagoides farinae TaxID=6954 RepID=A0A9D4SLP5_DERFA|nr:ras-related protein RABE1e-like [Dermatophagoides farinae]KAH7646342.1 hypothetical protein HUG17_1880 [Dermatophagoides farinae]